jgi:hypothetical protein
MLSDEDMSCAAAMPCISDDFAVIEALPATGSIATEIATSTASVVRPMFMTSSTSDTMFRSKMRKMRANRLTMRAPFAVLAALPGLQVSVNPTCERAEIRPQPRCRARIKDRTEIFFDQGE